jgi:Domain of unknown function (DUF4279)
MTMENRLTCRASLRVAGDTLVPAEVTRLLGCNPTRAHAKGELIKGKRTGREHAARTGVWCLAATNCEQGLGPQILKILNCLKPGPTAWADLASRYRVDLFCGVFLRRYNDGLSIGPDALAALAVRGIELSLDIYSAADNDHSGKADD